MSSQFRGQRPSEEIVLIVHAHPLVLLHPFLASVVIALLPVAAYSILTFGTLLFWIAVICWGVAAAVAWLAYYRWMNTLLLLSNERVIRLTQHGLLHRELTECTLGSIQQVSHAIEGLLHTVFTFGTLEITLGGSQQPIRVKNMPDPFEIQQEILKQAGNTVG